MTFNVSPKLLLVVKNANGYDAFQVNFDRTIINDFGKFAADVIDGKTEYSGEIFQSYFASNPNVVLAETGLDYSALSQLLETKHQVTDPNDLQAITYYTVENYVILDFIDGKSIFPDFSDYDGSHPSHPQYEIGHVLSCFELYQHFQHFFSFGIFNDDDVIYLNSTPEHILLNGVSVKMAYQVRKNEPNAINETRVYCNRCGKHGCGCTEAELMDYADNGLPF